MGSGSMNVLGVTYWQVLLCSRIRSKPIISSGDSSISLFGCVDSLILILIRCYDELWMLVCVVVIGEFLGT